MKAIIAILMLLFSAAAMAQNNASIIPLITLLLFDENCLISGEGVECVQTGKVRVPIGLTIRCPYNANWDVENIKYTESDMEVLFVIGETTDKPRLDVVLGYEADYFTRGTDFSVILKELAGNYITLVDGSTRDCSLPVAVQHNNFSAVGNEWQVTPVLSQEGGYTTLESLIFERQ